MRTARRAAPGPCTRAHQHPVVQVPRRLLLPASPADVPRQRPIDQGPIPPPQVEEHLWHGSTALISPQRAWPSQRSSDTAQPCTMTSQARRAQLHVLFLPTVSAHVIGSAYRGLSR